MRSFSISALLLVLSTGCATTPKTNDLSVAHNACYSYSYGEHGFEKNYEKAYEWCSIAANLGGSSSQTLLAELYFQGNGVTQSLETAADLYKKAALQGHQHAKMMVFLVNNVYREEQSSADEKAMGLLFLNEAVEAGYPKAVELQKEIDAQKI
ncbi:tetratricopeptide repeat protein [Parahaliea mediterranea]|uniref:Sel1 repeat family protein n=1 Tax=Parahaliea mediterranea TaxID=651086 RepID=A0A939DE91_9GAMM|nr:SEL1-like repeat protein [Parahaliea mediterranea]MBN7796286.1 sel1 repeat family protein [Parahaliea mediterranea]